MKKSLRIIDGRARTGLFSVATVLLENMILNGDKFDYRVELGSEYLYYDNEHGQNVWEYYFNQIQNSQVETEYETTERGFLFDRKGLLDVGNREENYSSTILKASNIFHKKIGFNPTIQREISEIRGQLGLANNYIAVHKRETDYMLHASEILRSDRFFREIESSLGDEKIFLATDSQKALWEFRLRYGSRLAYLRIPRSRDNTGLHFMEMSKTPNWRNGANAVFDCAILSNAKKLIRTRSNLTTFSMIMNPQIECVEMDRDVSIS